MISFVPRTIQTLSSSDVTDVSDSYGFIVPPEAVAGDCAVVVVGSHSPFGETNTITPPPGWFTISNVQSDSHIYSCSGVFLRPTGLYDLGEEFTFGSTALGGTLWNVTTFLLRSDQAGLVPWYDVGAIDPTNLSSGPDITTTEPDLLIAVSTAFDALFAAVSATADMTLYSSQWGLQGQLNNTVWAKQFPTPGATGLIPWLIANTPGSLVINTQVTFGMQEVAAVTADAPTLTAAGLNDPVGAPIAVLSIDSPGGPADPPTGGVVVNGPYTNFTWPGTGGVGYTDLAWNLTPLVDATPQGRFWAHQFGWGGTTPSPISVVGCSFGASSLVIRRISGNFNTDGVVPGMFVNDVTTPSNLPAITDPRPAVVRSVSSDGTTVTIDAPTPHGVAIADTLDFNYWKPDGGYFGFQTVDNINGEKVAIFSIFGAVGGEALGSSYPYADWFTNEGAGFSVRCGFNWQPDVTYRLRVTKYSSVAWAATIVDPDGNETVVGVIQVPPGWTNLMATGLTAVGSVHWTEDYDTAGNPVPPALCRDILHSSVQIDTVTGNNETVPVTGYTNHAIPGTGCQNTAYTDATVGGIFGVIQEMGTPVSLGATLFYEVQRAPDQATWVDVRSAYALPSAILQAAEDYEVIPLTPTYYRVRVVGIDPGTGIAVVGPWSNVVIVADATCNAMYFLMDPTNPTETVCALTISDDWAKVTHQVGTTFYALGRPNAIKSVDGTKGVWDGTWKFFTTDIPTRNRLRDLLAADVTMLLQSPLGEQGYIQTDPQTDPTEGVAKETVTTMPFFSTTVAVLTASVPPLDG